MELMDYLIDTNIVMVENGKLVWISAEELRSKAIDLPMPDMKRSSLSDEKQSPHFAQILQLDAHYKSPDLPAWYCVSLQDTPEFLY